MKIIPAVDIRRGKCVRLKKGKIEDETVYYSDPLQSVNNWVEQGAKRLHIVDLDGAFEGKPQNQSKIQRIAEKINIPIQVGGGIRTFADIRDYINSGVDRIILGTAAVKKPEMVSKAVTELGPESLAVGIDVDHQSVAVEGWVRSTGQGPIDLALRMKELGVQHIIYTDITRDGTLEGVQIDKIEDFISKVDIKTVVSGGIGDKEDIESIINLGHPNIEGIIIGQALYTGEVKLKEAQKIVSQCNEGGDI